MPDEMRSTVKPVVASKQEIREPLGSKVMMVPCGTGSVETVQVLFVYLTARPEFVVLLRPRNGGENVKRGDIWPEMDQGIEVFPNARFRILRESDDVRKVRSNSVPAAYLNNIAIKLRMILSLVSGDQNLAIERFNSDEYLKTSRPGEQLDKVFLFGNLRIALHKEGEIELLVDHCFQQGARFRIFVEIVGSEHHHFDASCFRSSQA